MGAGLLQQLQVGECRCVEPMHPPKSRVIESGIEVSPSQPFDVMVPEVNVRIDEAKRL
jgi:hypothetical protein